MLKNLLSPILLATTLAIALPARAQVPVDCGMSFIILPDGSCLDLDYTTILGSSRRSVGQANAAYQEVYEANIAIEVFRNQYPLLLNETEEEREERLKYLFALEDSRDEIAQTGQSIEDTLYPLHVYSMYRVGEAFR